MSLLSNFWTRCIFLIFCEGRQLAFVPTDIRRQISCWWKACQRYKYDTITHRCT